MNIKTFKESLPYLFKANIATLVHGHHGVGKSEGVRQFCEENGFDFVDLRLGTQDVGDLLGLADFKRDENGNMMATKFYQPEWFPTDPDSKGIIFMDEINRARPDVLQAVFQLVLDKRLHMYDLPKPVWDVKNPLKATAGWFVVGAMNPSTEDYIVTDLSDKAFLDRFCHIKLSPSKQEFFEYAKKIDVSTEIIQFLQDQPKMLQSELEEFNLPVTPSRRSWIAVDRLFKSKPPKHLQTELIKGLVGTTAGTAFLKSLNNGDKPVTAKEVLSEFNKKGSDVAKRIKKYSDPKSNRQSLLKFTTDSLRELCEGRTKKFNQTETKNFQDFLLTIPKDLCFDLCRELYMSDCARDAIDDHEELLKILANARNMKTDELPS